MKQFRITFRQEVIVEAKTQQEAEQIFQKLNLDDLQNELGNGIIKESGFVEDISFDEQ